MLGGSEFEIVEGTSSSQKLVIPHNLVFHIKNSQRRNFGQITVDLG
jgi:hypothetical protein